MKDWRVEKHHNGRWGYVELRHYCDDGRDGAAFFNGEWYCYTCGEVAPEEIDFCARLGNCVKYQKGFYLW